MTNDQRLSIAAGYRRNWLAEIKCRDPEKYLLMKKLGINGFKAEYDKRKNRVSEIFYEINDDPLLSFNEFYELYGKDLVNSIQGFWNFFGKYPFTSTNWRPIKTFKRNRLLIDRFNEYKRSKYDKQVSQSDGVERL